MRAALMERVAWVPGWYELDQPLAVGLTDWFTFWRFVPDNLRGPERLVLYNTLGDPGEVLFARGTIAAIWHPDLGAILRVDTRGLVYTIYLADGTRLGVEAEESPGELYEWRGSRWEASSRLVKDWRFVVEFESIDSLHPLSAAT
jgi:hypothetical protein